MIAARSAGGQVECFDVTENEHRDHILKISRAPADIPDIASALIQAQPSMAPIYNLAQRVLAASDVKTACIEFLDSMERNAACGLTTSTVSLIRPSLSSSVSPGCTSRGNSL